MEASYPDQLTGLLLYATFHPVESLKNQLRNSLYALAFEYFSSQ